VGPGQSFTYVLTSTHEFIGTLQLRRSSKDGDWVPQVEKIGTASVPLTGTIDSGTIVNETGKVARYDVAVVVYAALSDSVSYVVTPSTYAPAQTVVDPQGMPYLDVLEDAIRVKGLDFSRHIPGARTDGTMFGTRSSWITFSTAGQCALKMLCATSAASGDFATARFRGRADAAGNAEGVNSSASAGVNNHGNLCGVYASGQPMAYTNNAAGNIVCGMHSVIDATGASSGRRWSSWIDDHSETKAAAGHYLARLSQNGTVPIDGCFTIYNGGRMPVLFNFEDATAGGFLTDSGDAGSTKAGYLAVVTPAGTKFIQLVTV
jgi:hypothetical protein